MPACGDRMDEGELKRLCGSKAARDEKDDGFGAAAANQSVRLAIEAFGSVLDQTDASGQVRYLTWTGSTAGCLSRLARRQAPAGNRDEVAYFAQKLPSAGIAVVHLAYDNRPRLPRERLPLRACLSGI
jgi:hypothetical protein